MTNAQKLESAKQYMGTRWVLHPANATKRKKEFSKTNQDLRARLAGE